MADANEQEFANAASKVRFQDDIGRLKNSEGETVLVVTDDQEVGIGTATPRRALDVLDASNPQLRLTHTDNTHYSETQTSPTGNAIQSGSHATVFYDIKRGAVKAYSSYQAGASQEVDGGNKGLVVGTQSSGAAYIWSYGTGSNGTLNLGAGSGANAITIDASNNTTAVNNLSTNGNATLGDAGSDAHTLNGTLQFAEEVAAPSAPGAGDGGIFYVKDDGIPYYISNSTVETSLVGGGGGLTYENKTANFSAAVDYFYTVSSSGGDVTVNLPAVSGNAGKTIDVCHNVIGNNIIFDGNLSETINGATTLTFGGIAYQSITLFCTGIEWLVR